MLARRGVGAAALQLAAATALATAAAAAAGQPVLGARHLFTDGVGWGRPHPRVVFNGGDPNGRAWHLTWRRWGSRTTTAEGLTWIFRPGGGYFAKPGRIELEAFGLGRCVEGGPVAYLHLRARESVRPGGPFGRWFAWNGLSTICHGH